MGTTNKNTVLANNQRVSDGVNKHLAKVKNLTLAGVPYTAASLKATFAAETDANNALDQSRAQLKEQVATARTARAKASAARKALKAYVLGNYGADAVQMLKDLGIAVPKPLGPKTAKSKAQAADKATATKKAQKEALASIDAPAPAAPAPVAAAPKQ